MRRIIALLAIIVLGVGLLAACNNPSPSAPPPAPEPPTTTPDPTPDPDPPMMTDLDLTLKGWERGTADEFTWRITLVKTESSTQGIQADLVFDVGGNPRVTVNNTADTVAVLCEGLDNLAVMTSGKTVSFSGRTTAACPATAFAAFDSRAETHSGTSANGVLSGDDLMFELTLDSLPDTMAMMDAKAQEIKFMGTVTITHAKSDGGTPDDDTDDTVDKTVSYDLSGMAKYDTPMIEPAGN